MFTILRPNETFHGHNKNRKFKNDLDDFPLVTSFLLFLFVFLLQYDDGDNIAAQKRGTIHRNLNERGASQIALDKKALRRALITAREERDGVIMRQTRRVGREVSSESYKRMVSRFDEVFNADLADFMIQLNSHTATGVMANLGIRLDYNGYVTASIAMNR